MEVNAKLDIGNNLTSLLERLAQQIGTTVDKVYPWYVQQAHLEGLTTCIAFGLWWFVFGLLLACTIRKADFENGNKSTAASLIAFGALTVSLVPAVIELPDAARKMLNPNFYAMKMLTTDIGRMRGK